MKIITYMFIAYAIGMLIGATNDPFVIVLGTGIMATVLWTGYKFIFMSLMKSTEVSKLVAKFTQQMTQDVVSNEVTDILKSVLASLKKNATTRVSSLKLPDNVGTIFEREIVSIFEESLRKGVKFKTRRGATGEMKMMDKDELEEETYDLSDPKDVDKVIEKLRGLKKK
jgi:predicted transcriptional regulator